MCYNARCVISSSPRRPPPWHYAIKIQRFCYQWKVIMILVAWVDPPPLRLHSLTNSAATPYIEESKWLPIMGNRRRPKIPQPQNPNPMDLRVQRRHKKREGKVERDTARVFYMRLSQVRLKIQFNSIQGPGGARSGFSLIMTLSLDDRTPACGGPFSWRTGRCVIPEKKILR